MVLTLALARMTCGPCLGAVSELRYTLSVRELFSEDIFRTGDQAKEDFLTTFGLGVNWNLMTPRSTWRLDYTPQYSAYSKFDQLNHLDHQVQTTWQLQPGRRSVIGLRQGYSFSNRQSTFHEFQGLQGDQANPVVPTTRRVVWDVTPFHNVELSRRWTLATEGTYRSQTFSNPDLVDSTQVGLQMTLTAKAGADYRVGGRVRGDRYEFSTQSSTVSGVPLDRFMNAEMVWERDRPGTFNWSILGGMFRASGPGASSLAKPTADLSASWAYRVSRLQVSYALGYASAGGFGGAARSQSGEVDFARHWGTAFDTSVRGAYIRREPLDLSSSGQGAVEGGSLDLQGTYRWRTGLGLQFQIDAVHQNRPDFAPLDYREASLGLIFSPTIVSRPSAPLPASGLWRLPLHERTGR